MDVNPEQRKRGFVEGTMIDPITAFIDAGVDTGAITLFQAQQTIQDPSLAAGEHPVFESWEHQGLVGEEALPGILRASLCKLAADAAYADQHRGDLVLAAILLDSGKIAPSVLHRAMGYHHLARCSGYAGKLEDYLDEEGTFSKKAGREMMGATTFPSWLPIVRRRSVERRKANLGPPPGVSERRKVERRRLAVAMSVRRRQRFQWVVGLVFVPASLVLAVVLYRAFSVVEHPESSPEAPMTAVSVRPARPVEPSSDPIGLRDEHTTPMVTETAAAVPVASQGLSRSLPDDLRAVPDRVKRLIDEARGGPATEAQKLADAETLLRTAIGRLEAIDTKDGRDLHGECQALLHLVLKMRTH